MIMHRGEQTLAIRALKSAAPYIRMYKGKTFIVKAGGGVFGDADATRVLIEQIAILHYFGVRVVMVHGGGPQTTEISEALGIPARMVEGRRVTDQKAIDVAAMVLNGLINTRILGMCRDLNIDAVGISGVDAGRISCGRVGGGAAESRQALGRPPGACGKSMSRRRTTRLYRDFAQSQGSSERQTVEGHSAPAQVAQPRVPCH